MAKFFIKVTNSEDGKSSTATITPFGRGKPSYEMLTNECAIDGTLICGGKDPESVPKPTAMLSPGEKSQRFYKLADGSILPFGRGRPGAEKLSAECTATGEKVDNGFDPNAPKVSSNSQAAKVSSLEAQIQEMRAMIALMQVLPKAPEVKVEAPPVATVANAKSKARANVGKSSQATAHASHFADDCETLDADANVGSLMDGDVVFTDD